MAHRSKRAKNKELDGRCVDERLKEEAKPRIDGRFRRVDPYLYRFQCYTKGRWIGRTILEVFAKEFRANTREYYVDRTRGGCTKSASISNTSVSCTSITTSYVLFVVLTRHPIANDPLYGRRVWTRDATPAAVAADLDTALEQRERAQEDAKVRQDAKARQKSRGQGDVAAVEQGGARGGEEHRMVGCADCNRVYPDPSDEDMCLYLHACKFTCSVGTFTTRVPSWAQQPNNPRTPSQQQEQEQEQQQRWWSSSSCSLQ
ncbi:hypothetical protein PTSG_00771 [Salpingoeca rosetta]|uniref:Uncharacterized protein n=1 Tax=Salpingoeca rosetta (strain ATCC 50818 / BSB-021) TaxID=946362 RepID=F2TXF3_SALR5|nr:uncharacterized protein PTSG_00771 [Salpingoeca rosetta]EGD76062.1 hypothetical protein PTSG_00771 [Salpingoeca rosetta]|eukprot:XP_004998237.1 hypothetical protein PTSG_00771 [Salpingoeca rosetta]